jgi:hypothetical protein
VALINPKSVLLAKRQLLGRLLYPSDMHMVPQPSSTELEDDDGDELFEDESDVLVHLQANDAMLVHLQANAGASPSPCWCISKPMLVLRQANDALLVHLQ